MPSFFKRGNAPYESQPFVAVIGLHRSGSSDVAGVIHHLGVYMGEDLVGYEPRGGFEALGLARICEMAMPFPSTRPTATHDDLVKQFRSYLRRVQTKAAGNDTIAGGKYPHLCAMGSALRDASEDNLLVIHVNRPLDKSIALLQARFRDEQAWPGINDTSLEGLQRSLWAHKQEFLASVEHLTVESADLYEDPPREVERIIEYLGLEPTPEQRAAAVGHVSGAG